MNGLQEMEPMLVCILITMIWFSIPVVAPVCQSLSTVLAPEC